MPVRSRRLLLLAMSGVRVRNERLLRLGVTLPGFVERSRVIASLPSLGLLTLAAYTPPHWQIEYREIDELSPDAASQIAAERFDVVAISALSARVLEAYALADSLRAAGTTVVLGGLHVSALPEEAAPHSSAVVQGEGETVWPELLGDFERGELRPLYSSFGREAVPVRLESAPVPRYDLLDIQRYNRLTLQTERGCPLDCTFCGASRTISPYTVKPLSQVRRELEAILARWPRPFVELADDNSFASPGRSRELARLLGEYPIRWFTETDVSVGDDERLLELLARSGCAQLLIGFEAARPEPLRGLDSRDWKLHRFDRYREQIARIQSYGISVNGCLVLGFDEDDASVFDTTREWIRDSDLSEVQITILTPFPGTLLYRSLRDSGRLLRPVYWDQCTLFDVTFRPARMSPEELERGFHDLMRDVYSDDAVAARRGKFRGCVRAVHGRRSAPVTGGTHAG